MGPRRMLPRSNARLLTAMSTWPSYDSPCGGWSEPTSRPIRQLYSLLSDWSFCKCFFFRYLTMPKTKKNNKMKTKAEGSGKSLLVKSSIKCKEFVIALIARFYERESTMSLNSCYVWYVKEGITKFKMDMTQRIMVLMDALHNNKRMEEIQKSGY